MCVLYIRITKRTSFVNIKNFCKFGMDQEIIKRYRKKRNLDMKILNFLHETEMQNKTTSDCISHLSLVNSEV